jgi:pyruvate kinase
MYRQTKIGATFGPNCQEKPLLSQLHKAGLNFARLNLTYGTREENIDHIVKMRAVEAESGRPIPILADLQGPRLRLGALPDGGVKLIAGQTITLSSAPYAAGNLPLDYPDIAKFLKPKHAILIDDGRVELSTVSVRTGKITASVVQGGTVFSHKGINLPHTELKIPVLSDKDKTDVRFAVEQELEFIGLSFTSCAKDIVDLRKLIEKTKRELKKTNEYPPLIIAKIERHDAVHNLDEIIAAADGIMVARGDLGLELPSKEVPLIQKRIIDAANAAGKPVIVATQLLDSMRENPRPTRAEVSDVANAVIDHADALLLTNETAVGKYPVEAVSTMADIMITTERSKYDDTALPDVLKKGSRTEEAVADLSRILAEEVDAKLILAASITGETGRLISHVRPNLPILVATHDVTVWRQLNISWGVKPFILPPCSTIEELIERSVAHIKEHKLAQPGEKMIIVAGEPVGIAGNVNLVEVRQIK